MELRQHLVPKLKQLRLSGILDSLEVRNRQAIDEQWSYIAFLEHLLEDEVERRAQKQLALRLRRAALASDKTLETGEGLRPSLKRTASPFAFHLQPQRQPPAALRPGDLQLHP